MYKAKTEAEEHVTELEKLLTNQTEEFTCLREAMRSPEGDESTGKVEVVKLKRRLSELEAEKSLTFGGRSFADFQIQLDEQARTMSKLKMENLALRERIQSFEEQSKITQPTNDSTIMVLEGELEQVGCLHL